MKKGLVIFLVGVFFWFWWIQTALAEEEINKTLDLTKRGDRETILKENGILIDLPIPIKIQIRKVNVNDIAGGGVIEEKSVGREELKEALKKAEEKRNHFTQRKSVTPPQQLRGTIVKRGPLGGADKKEYVVPPVEMKRGPYSSILRQEK
ncbi:MAG: hypothetical protein HY590_03065 [Candidatus Omnitrophica bacterium]|nr:hypothetical protein [Candidatus Omnitrophota bacterium]